MRFVDCGKGGTWPSSVAAGVVLWKGQWEGGNRCHSQTSGDKKKWETLCRMG